MKTSCRGVFLTIFLWIVILGHSYGDLREVAIVNDIPGHFEVLAGVVTVLLRLQLSPRVYYVGRADAPESLGIVSWLGRPQSAVQWRSMKLLDQVDQPQIPADTVICISAELAPKVCKQIVDLLKPSMLVMWVHRADTATPTAKILSLHPRFQLLALAPHVATLAQTRLRHPVKWTMPVAAFIPQKTCGNLACLKGFVVQGALRKYRNKSTFGFTRNYTRLWERMAQVKHERSLMSGADHGGVVNVCVLGKGGGRDQLEIPPEIDQDVEYAENARLPYPAFWGRIYSSLALVPAFGLTGLNGSPVYYESRISSTIIASLVTGTPMIVEPRLLEVYTFLKEDHVFLRQDGEDEVEGMYRVMEMPEAEVMAKRRALVSLAEELTISSTDMIRRIINRVA